MKPHPRIRKTIKWTGAAVTLLLVVVWIGSTLKQLGWYGTSGWHFIVAAGCFEIGYSSVPRNLTGFLWVDDSSPFYLTPTASTTPPGWWVSMPIWLFAAPVLAGTTLGWRLDILTRRARGGLNLCPKCNYDRAGLAAGAVCPECGSAPTISAS